MLALLLGNFSAFTVNAALPIVIRTNPVDNLGIIWLDGFSFTDFQGLKVAKFSDDLAVLEKNGKYGFIDKNGNEALPFNFEFAADFSEGLAAVKKNGKWTFIDKNGTTISPFQYDSVNSFSEGLASVRKNDKSGFIDKNGAVVIPLDLDYADSFNEGYAAAGRDDKYGYINKQGEEIIAFEYDWVHPFSNRLGYVMILEGNGEKWSYVDGAGNVALPFTFDGYGKNSEGLISANRGQYLVGKKGYLDRIGQEIIPFIYDAAAPFSEGLAAVTSGLDWGYIDRDGNQIIPFSYKSALSFSEGLAAVGNGSKMGYIDYQGNQIIPFLYTNAGPFMDGMARVSKGKKYGFINRMGDEVLPVVFDDVSNVHEGMVFVEYEGRLGIFRIGNLRNSPYALSDWAKGEVELAIENKLVPKHLQSYYKDDITRLEFAQLVIPCIEEIKSKSIDDILVEKTDKDLDLLLKEHKFTDTEDKNVIAAKILGIINGVGGGKFNPNGKITREQAAALLQRTAKYLGADVSDAKLTFDDKDKISEYARNPVAFVAKLEVMKGTGMNRFSPKGYYTRQQAYMTIYRLYKILNN